jgi:hypothetical protein
MSGDNKHCIEVSLTSSRFGRLVAMVSGGRAFARDAAGGVSIWRRG